MRPNVAKCDLASGSGRGQLQLAGVGRPKAELVERFPPAVTREIRPPRSGNTPAGAPGRGAPRGQRQAPPEGSRGRLLGPFWGLFAPLPGAANNRHAAACGAGRAARGRTGGCVGRGAGVSVEARACGVLPWSARAATRAALAALSAGVWGEAAAAPPLSLSRRSLFGWPPSPRRGVGRG
eukprot:scaffold1686_cov371-Prasinococcus_capsulatus_cf.AAC.6